MRTRLYSVVKFLIGLPLTLLAFFFIFKIIATQIPTLVSNIHSIHYFMLAYGVASFLIFYFLRSYVWYRILKNYQYTLSFRESSYLWSLSELKRYIPGNIWSFLGRTVLFQKKGVQKKDIAKGLIIEAELFVLGSAVVFLLALSFFFPKEQWFYIQLITLVILLVSLLYCLNSSVRVLVKGKLERILLFLFPPFSLIENALLLLVSIVALFFFGLGNYFVIDSVIFLTPKLLLELIGVFAFAFVVGYVSIVTPAGFGVREGIMIYALARIIPAGFAAFGALFSRIILICSELLFIGFNTAWYRIRNKRIAELEKIIMIHPQVSILSFFVLCYMVYFTIVSFLRYDNYYTGRFDLGNMAQTVWNSLHGRIFYFTNPNGTNEISRLAFHADFILVLLAPLYALWQNPGMLLLIQTVVLAIGAYFVYIIASNVVKNRNLGLLFGLMYLLNPSVERTNIYDFHAVTLATTFFLATYYFFMKKRYVLFILFAVLAALCKEEIWLTISFFGILVFFLHKKRLFGSIIFFLSIAMFYFLFWIAIPKTLGSQHFALAYLSDFGDSPTKVIKGLFLSPNKIIGTILTQNRLDYLNQLALPFGYVFIFFPFFLIFSGPDLLIDLLSNNPQLHQIYYQYTATITPFIFLSAIYGVSVLQKIPLPKIELSFTYRSFLIGVYLLFYTLQGVYAFGPLPGARDPNLDMFIKQLPDSGYIDVFLHQIPKRFSVAASNDIGSHLSSRRNIYAIPYGLDRADVVVLLLDGTDPQAKGIYAKLLTDPHYSEVTRRDGFVAFERK